MNAPTVKIERALDVRYPTKARHLFALVLEVGDLGQSRYAGLNKDGKPTWIYRSAAQAHGEFKYYVPGEWFHFPNNERVLSVHLYREDGKSWHKNALEQTECHE